MDLTKASALLILCVNIIEIYSICISNGDTTHYQTIFELSQNDNQGIIESAFQQCSFGRLQQQLDLHLCLKHCSLLSNCLAVAMDLNVAGCKLCLYGEGSEDFSELNQNATYANLTRLQSVLGPGRFPLIFKSI